MLSRLGNFNDKPEDFHSWKASFISVVKDLGATPAKEIDLFVKYLGVESKRYAVSLRSVYLSDLAEGREKIWERLALKLQSS